MKLTAFGLFLILSLLFINYTYSLELCGPRSCKNGSFCVSLQTTAVCRPEAQAYTIIQVNITNEGAWPDSAQFKGTITNICGVRIKKIVLGVQKFAMLKSSAIWNARYSKEFEEITVPDFADGILPIEDPYTFGFILKNSNLPPIIIKSIRF
ncbi:hypothetical protein ACTFIZ_001081 [Dictyostelium cf. discoideum]